MPGGLSGPGTVVGATVTSGGWTPTFSGVTVVGAPAHTGTWRNIGNKTIQYQITIAAATSVATTSGASCTNFPFFGILGYTPCLLVSDDQLQSAIGLGGGNADVIYLYGGTVIAATPKIHVSGFVFI